MKNRIYQKGMSLLSVIVAMAIMGIITGFIYRFISFQYQYFALSREKGSVEDIRALIRMNIDCYETLKNDAIDCNSVDFIPIAIKKHDGTTLVMEPLGNTFERYGVFAVKGECRKKPYPSAGHDFRVRINRLSKNGAHAIGDPVGGRLMDLSAATSSSPNTSGWVDLNKKIFSCFGY